MLRWYNVASVRCIDSALCKIFLSDFAFGNSCLVLQWITGDTWLEHRRIGEGLQTPFGGKICFCDGGASIGRVKNMSPLRQTLWLQLAQHTQIVSSPGDHGDSVNLRTIQ